MNICKYGFIQRSLIFLLCTAFTFSFAVPSGKLETLKNIQGIYKQAEYLAARKKLLKNSEEQHKLYSLLKVHNLFDQFQTNTIEKDVYLGLSFDLTKIPENDIAAAYQLINATNELSFLKPWHGVLLYQEFKKICNQISDKNFMLYMGLCIKVNKRTALVRKLDDMYPIDTFVSSSSDQYYIRNFKDMLLKACSKKDFIDLASPIFYTTQVFKDIENLVKEYEEKQNTIQHKYANLCKKYKGNLTSYPQELPTLDQFIEEINEKVKAKKVLKLQDELRFVNNFLKKDKTDFLPDNFLQKEEKRKQRIQNEHNKKLEKKKKKQTNKKVSKPVKKELKQEELEEKEIIFEKKEFDEVSFYNKKYKSIDGSSVKSITDQKIKIDDLRNRAIITLIKVKEAKRVNPKRLNRDDRVQKWFDNSIQALIDRGELKETMKRKDLLWELEYNIRRHAFADIVDAFVGRYGVDSEYIDENDRKIPNKVIPGEIEFNDRLDLKTGQPIKITGLFTYGNLPRTDTCYHRFFTRKPFNDQLKEFMEIGKWIVKKEE